MRLFPSFAFLSPSLTPACNCAVTFCYTVPWRYPEAYQFSDQYHGLPLRQAEALPYKGCGQNPVRLVKERAYAQRDIYLQEFNSGKRLLSRIESDDTIRADSEQDLESQNSRSYDTFGRCNSPDESIVTTTSNCSRERINPRIISDAILGLSDGLTVPFALSAGLSALGNTKVVVLGGLAELAAGAISMGLGGYVGAKSEA